MRSASRIASSTSLVIITTVFFSCDQISSISTLQLGARERVERRQRLVEQQHLRVHGERARHRHALAHAAGQFRRLAVAGVRQADHLDVAVDARLRVRFAGCAGRTQRRPPARYCRAPRATASANSFGRRRRARGRARFTGSPLNSTSPLSGVARPAIRLISVVLPEPEKPTMATNSPSSTASETFLSTRVRVGSSP